MSNTFHLSGDNWELSGRSLSSMQTIVFIDVITPKLAPVETGNPGQNESAECLEAGAQPRSGDLTAAWIPGTRFEALRDMVRACEAAEQDQLRARHLLSTFLRRTGSGQGLTSIARYRADFGSNHCSEVGPYFG